MKPFEEQTGFEEQSRGATISNEDLSRISDEDLAQKLSPYFSGAILEKMATERKALSDCLFVKKAFKSLKKPISDKPLIFELLEVDPRFLRFVDEKLIENKEFISEIKKKNFLFSDLVFVPDSFKKDKDFARYAIGKASLYLRFIDDSLKKDEEFILSIVKKDGLALQYVIESLRDNKNIVLEAIGQDPLAVIYASEELKKDREVALKAIEKSEVALLHIDPELTGTKEFLEEMIGKIGGQFLRYFCYDFLNNPEMVKIAMQEVATRHEKKGYDGTEKNIKLHYELLKCQMCFLKYSEDPKSRYAPHKDMLEKACKDHIQQMIQQGMTPSFSPTPDQQVSQPSDRNVACHL